MRQLEAGEKQGKDMSWHELNAVEVVAANSLGYDSFSWDRGEAPWPCQQPWESLNREQLYAADVRCAPHTHSHTFVGSHVCVRDTLRGAAVCL